MKKTPSILQKGLGVIKNLWSPSAEEVENSNTEPTETEIEESKASVVKDDPQYQEQEPTMTSLTSDNSVFEGKDIYQMKFLELKAALKKKDIKFKRTDTKETLLKMLLAAPVENKFATTPQSVMSTTPAMDATFSVQSQASGTSAVSMSSRRSTRQSVRRDTVSSYGLRSDNISHSLRSRAVENVPVSAGSGGGSLFKRVRAGSVSSDGVGHNIDDDFVQFDVLSNFHEKRSPARRKSRSPHHKGSLDAVTEQETVDGGSDADSVRAGTDSTDEHGGDDADDVRSVAEDAADDRQFDEQMRAAEALIAAQPQSPVRLAADADNEGGMDAADDASDRDSDGERDSEEPQQEPEVPAAVAAEAGPAEHSDQGAGTSTEHSDEEEDQESETEPEPAQPVVEGAAEVVAMQTYEVVADDSSSAAESEQQQEEAEEGDDDEDDDVSESEQPADTQSGEEDGDESPSVASGEVVSDSAQAQSQAMELEGAESVSDGQQGDDDSDDNDEEGEGEDDEEGEEEEEEEEGGESGDDSYFSSQEDHPEEGEEEGEGAAQQQQQQSRELPPVASAAAYSLGVGSGHGGEVVLLDEDSSSTSEGEDEDASSGGDDSEDEDDAEDEMQLQEAEEYDDVDSGSGSGGAGDEQRGRVEVEISSDDDDEAGDADTEEEEEEESGDDDDGMEQEEEEIDEEVDEDDDEQEQEEDDEEDEDDGEFVFTEATPAFRFSTPGETVDLLSDDDSSSGGDSMVIGAPPAAAPVASSAIVTAVPPVVSLEIPPALDEEARLALCAFNKLGSRFATMVAAASGSSSASSSSSAEASQLSEKEYELLHALLERSKPAQLTIAAKPAAEPAVVAPVVVAPVAPASPVPAQPPSAVGTGKRKVVTFTTDGDVALVADPKRASIGTPVAPFPAGASAPATAPSSQPYEQRVKALSFNPEAVTIPARSFDSRDSFLPSPMASPAAPATATPAATNTNLSVLSSGFASQQRSAGGLLGSRRIVSTPYSKFRSSVGASAALDTGLGSVVSSSTRRLPTPYHSRQPPSAELSSGQGAGSMEVGDGDEEHSLRLTASSGASSATKDTAPPLSSARKRSFFDTGDDHATGRDSIGGEMASPFASADLYSANFSSSKRLSVESTHSGRSSYATGRLSFSAAGGSPVGGARHLESPAPVGSGVSSSQFTPSQPPSFIMGAAPAPTASRVPSSRASYLPVFKGGAAKFSSFQAPVVAQESSSTAAKRAASPAASLSYIQRRRLQRQSEGGASAVVAKRILETLGNITSAAEEDRKRPLSLTWKDNGASAAKEGVEKAVGDNRRPSKIAALGPRRAAGEQDAVNKPAAPVAPQFSFAPVSSASPASKEAKPAAAAVKPASKLPVPGFGFRGTASAAVNVPAAAVTKPVEAAVTKPALTFTVPDKQQPAPSKAPVSLPAGDSEFVFAEPKTVGAEDLGLAPASSAHIKYAFSPPNRNRQSLSAAPAPAVESSSSSSNAAVAKTASTSNSSAAETTSTTNIWAASAINAGVKCGACMVRNKVGATKCVSCETPLSTEAAGKSSTSAPAPAAGVPAAPEGNSIWSMSAINAGVKCDACMVRNKVGATKCVSCETPLAASAPAAATVTTSSSGSTGAFTFGTAPSSSATTAPSGGGFTFGASATPAAAAVATTAGGFTFGSAAPAATSATTDTKAAEKTGFSFGASEVTKAPTAGAFAFGAPAATSAAPSGSAFTFGATPAAAAPAAVSFPVAVADKRPAEKEEQEEDKPSKKRATISWGDDVKPPAAAAATVPSFGAPAASSSAPSAFGGFGGSVPAAAADATKSLAFGVSTTPSSQPADGAFGATIDSAVKPTAASPAFAGFGSPAPAASAKPDAASTASAAPPGVSFGFSSNAANTGGFGASTTVETKTDAFAAPKLSFGSSDPSSAAKGANPFGASLASIPEDKPFAGASSAPAPASGGGSDFKPFSFGAAPLSATAGKETTASAPVFGGFGATPAKAADAGPFGQLPKQASSDSLSSLPSSGAQPFTFGGSAPPPASTAQPPFIFGGGATPAATPAASTAPGAFTFGAAPAAKTDSNPPGAFMFGAAAGAATASAQPSSAGGFMGSGVGSNPFGGPATAAPAAASAPMFGGFGAAASAPAAPFAAPQANANPFTGSFGAPTGGSTSSLPSSASSTPSFGFPSAGASVTPTFGAPAAGGPFGGSQFGGFGAPQQQQQQSSSMFGGAPPATPTQFGLGPSPVPFGGAPQQFGMGGGGSNHPSSNSLSGMGAGGGGSTGFSLGVSGNASQQGGAGGQRRKLKAKRPGQ